MSRPPFLRFWKACLPLAPLLVLLLVSLGSNASHAERPRLDGPFKPTCQQAALVVSFGLLNLNTAQVIGTLCSAGPLQGRTVQVLVSGATYGPIYWDFPYVPATYSYVRALTAAGYATFNLARLGIAPSSQPNALAVTMDVQASVLHQVIQALRHGQIGGVAFPRVVLVGHSLGSLMAIAEAATYADVDGLIVTGFLHNTGVDQIISLLHLYSAQNDPLFAGISLPSGYLTTRPGTRGVYYALDDTDPAALQEDEATKATVTSGEIATAIPTEGVPPSLLIRVPVLLAVGEHDNIFCGVTNCLQAMQAEKLFYSPAACLESFVLPGAGHSINLHENAPLWFQRAITWLNQRIGPTTDVPPTMPC